MKRRAITLLELLIAAVILGLGIVPLFDMLRGARGILDNSQEMLLVQNRALQVLAEGTALAASGALADLGAEEEEVLETEDQGVRSKLVIERVAGSRHFRMTVRTEASPRWFELSAVVADPLASYQAPDQEPLPEARHDDEGDEH